MNYQEEQATRDQKIGDFKKELKQLLEKYEATLNVDLDGDTHGLSTDFTVSFGRNGKEHMLNQYNPYLDANDLED